MSAVTTTPDARRDPHGDDGSGRRSGARRERRHLRAIDDRPRRHPLVFVGLYLVVAIGAVMGAVSLNALAAQDAVEVTRVEAEVVDAERAWTHAIADVAALEDPARIRLLAEQMGMQPTPQRYLVPSQVLPGDRSDVTADDPIKPILSADR